MESLNDRLITAREAESFNARFSRVRDRIVDQLRGAAERIYQPTEPEAPAHETSMGAVCTQTSAMLNKTADYIEGIDPQTIKRNVTVQVRKNPGTSLLIAGTAGFILSAMLRRR